MASSPRPTARSLVVCEQIVSHPDAPTQVSLIRLVWNIRPAGGSSYPIRHGELSVFAQLTECRGTGKVRVQVRHDESGNVVSRTPDRRSVFPNEPLAVYGFRLRVLDVPFPEPGLYWVQLCYDDDVIAETPLTLLPPAPRGAE